MVRLVVLTKMFTCAVQSSLHCGHGDAQGLGNLPMAAPLLDEGEQGAVLGPELGKRVPEGVEFLCVDSTLGLCNVLMLRTEGKEDPPELLPAEVVYARVPGQAK